MQVLNLVILAAVSFVSLVLGFLSLLKNYHSLTHKLFAILTVSLVGWATANYISITVASPEYIFWAVQAVLFFVVLQHTFLFFFAFAYPGNSLGLRRGLAALYLAFSFVTLLVGIAPGYFEGYEPTADSISVQPSPFIGFFMAHMIISIVAVIWKLVARHRQSRGLRRNQFKFLLLAVSLLLILSPFTNFALPTLFDLRWFVPFSPLYTLVFAVVIAYAMLKHHLLDFRLLVARAFAYALTMGLLSLAYAMAVFGISSLVLGLAEVEQSIFIVYTLLALALAVSFQSVKRFFDRLSNKIFFRDAYDPQVLLNELNKVLVGQVDLEPLLRETNSIIESNFKSQYSAFIVRETEGMPLRIIGDESRKDVGDIVITMPKTASKITITDYLNDNDTLRQQLSQKDIAVVVQLSWGDEKIGELVMGQKKSGNPYTQQDAQLLEIIGNELVIAVQNALRFEEIRHFNVTLQEEVKRATQQLRQKNERLRVLDQTKDDFISMASHQLRTPLTSVKGYVSMVLEGDAGKINPLQRKLLNQSFVSSQRMVYLISDLLNVSRLRTGKFVIEPVKCNLATAVENEVEQLQETAKGRNLELIYHKPEHFPALMLDETKLRQVIMNFIDNAIYYTPSGGKIEVALADKPQSVEFTVTDTGIGVSKREQPHLFTKFFRAHNAQIARPDGTGLGLFMAKKVVVAQGGAIIFKSRERKGSTFGFTIPKRGLEVAAQVKPPTGKPDKPHGDTRTR